MNEEHVINRHNADEKHCVSCGIVMGRLVAVNGEVPWYRTELDSGNGQCTYCIENKIKRPSNATSPEPVIEEKSGAVCVDCGVEVFGKNQRCEEHQRQRRLWQSKLQGEMRKDRKRRERGDWAS